MRFAWSLVLLAIISVTSLPTPTDVLSQEAGDVAYEGTQEAGGPVRMVVSADLARIMLFEIEGVAGGGCSWDTLTLENWGGEIALAEGAFSVTNADGDVLDGALLVLPDQPSRFEGTIQVHDPVKGCQTPPLRWVAAPVP